MDDTIWLFFKQAFEKFLAEEASGIVGGVHEQNLCSQLARRLDAMKAEFGFDEYHVDTEYNRMLLNEGKKILRKGTSVGIRADLIIHVLGTRDNLIALEMKKQDRKKRGQMRRDNDRDRLMAMTNSDVTAPTDTVAGYRLGLFVELDPKKRTWFIEEFRSGRSVRTSEGLF